MPGLSHQHRELTVADTARSGLTSTLGGERQHAYSRAPDTAPATPARCVLLFCEIELVHHDQHADALMRGGGQAAIQQLFVEGRHRGQHDHHLRDIGGDQLLTVAIAAIEQGAARIDRFDHALAGGGAHHLHPISACERGCACRGEST